MKKFTIKIMLIGVFVATFNQSCTDLEERLYDTVTPENFFKTEEEFIAALGAAYTSLYGLMNHNSYFSIQEVSSDEIMIPQRGADWLDGGVWLRTHRHESNALDAQYNNAWNFLFGGVNNVNRLLFQFDQLIQDGQLDPEVARPFTGELRVLRALWYYWLLDSFGNVPLVTRFDVPDDFAPTNNTRQEVYAFVESEVTEVLPLLTQQLDGATYGRIQFYAAQALLAKLYLNASVYIGTEQWDKCIAACDAIINSGRYNLEADYFTNFNANNSGSGENIFSIPYDRVFAGGFNLPMMTLHYGSQRTWNFTAQPWNGYCTLQEFYDSYSDDDRRKGVWGNQKIRGNFHAGPQFQVDGVTPILDASFDDPDGPELVFTPFVNQLFPNCWRQAGARVGKFEFLVGGTPDLDNDFPIFRYADILLTKAEALWRKNPGDPAALALVNQIRERSGVAPFNSLTAENLLSERGREMFYEGWRRQDLIRFGQFSRPWFFKETSVKEKELWPIPFTQLDANKSLRQNPGY
jgi:hypothetical protein